MAIFAVMHIFAFPWKGYSIKRAYADPTNVPGTGYSVTVPSSARYNEEGRELGMDMKYKGGFMGWKAIADAFNPWDIIKMTARGFRWLFVGARYRHEDSSYQQPTKMQGMGWDGANDAREAPRSSSRGRSDTVDTVGTVDDDHAGLLANQRVPSRSPYRTSAKDSDDGAGRPPPAPQSSGARDFGMSPPSELQADTAYHPGFGPAPSAVEHSRQKANLDAHRQEGQGWDVFGGATGARPPVDQDGYGVEGAGDASNVRQPESYRAYDPRRPG